MRTTDECQNHADFREPVTSFGYRLRSELAPDAGRCLVRFTTLHALRRSARAPCSGFSPPHRGVNSKLFSSGPPLTPLSPRWFAHHARATMSTNSAEIAFPILPVKRERLPRPETPSIETMPKDPRYPCGHPPSASTNPRFCHRGSPSDAPSPGAVSRFGLAPVHPRRRSDTSFFGQ